ncbi:MAG: HepT-like ribonuclease domain-containing protein [Ignavibacteria bacterium]
MYRDWKLLFEDIIESINKIKLYTSGLSFDDFNLDSKTIDAVVRNFEIIGEAGNKIPEEIKIKFKNIEWNKIIGLRNRVIHEYFGVDNSIFGLL